MNKHVSWSEKPLRCIKPRVMFTINTVSALAKAAALLKIQGESLVLVKYLYYSSDDLPFMTYAFLACHILGPRTLPSYFRALTSRMSFIYNLLLSNRYPLLS